MGGVRLATQPILAANCTMQLHWWFDMGVIGVVLDPIRYRGGVFWPNLLVGDSGGAGGFVSVTQPMLAANCSI